MVDNLEFPKNRFLLVAVGSQGSGKTEVIRSILKHNKNKFLRFFIIKFN